MWLVCRLRSDGETTSNVPSLFFSTVSGERRIAESTALNVMEQYADLGVIDSELLWRLGDVCDEISGFASR
jgi:hypothetical protein